MIEKIEGIISDLYWLTDENLLEARAKIEGKILDGKEDADFLLENFYVSILRLIRQQMECREEYNEQ